MGEKAKMIKEVGGGVFQLYDFSGESLHLDDMSQTIFLLNWAHHAQLACINIVEYMNFDL